MVNVKVTCQNGDWPFLREDTRYNYEIERISWREKGRFIADNVYARTIKTFIAFTDCLSEWIEQTLQSLSNPANLLENSDPRHIDWPSADISEDHNL